MAGGDYRGQVKSAKDMKLTKGDKVEVVIKSMEVMLRK
jgi:molybdopterin-binding protein